MSETYDNDCVQLQGFEGDSFDYTFTVREPTTEALQDLTSYAIRFLLGSINESTSGVTITNGGALGTIRVQITYSAMEALTVGSYDIALEITLSTARTTLFTGTFEVLEDHR